MKRINYLDATRGFAMVTVVMAHTMGKCLNIGNYNNVLWSLIITFFLPLFFFVSGFLSYKEVDFNLKKIGQNILQKFTALVVPAFLMFCIWQVSHGCSPLAFIKQGFGGYWFTFVLFEMFLIYYCITWIGSFLSNKIVDAILILLAVMGVLWLMKANRQGVFYQVLCMENLAKYWQFFVLGLLCKKYNGFFIRCMDSDAMRGIIIFSFMLSFLLCFHDGFKNRYGLAYAMVHDIFVRYAGVLTVIVFFYMKRSFFDGKSLIAKVMVFIGKRTLDIYLLHYFFIPHLFSLKEYMANGANTTFLIQLVVVCLLSGLIIALSLLCSELIRSSNVLAHFLLGAKRH